MKKRISAFILSFSVIFSTVGCSSNNTPQQTDNNDSFQTWNNNTEYSEYSEYSEYYSTSFEMPIEENYENTQKNGLLILRADLVNMRRPKFEIISFDPDTQNETTLSTFSNLRWIETSDDYTYFPPNAGTFWVELSSNYGNFKDWFNNDYTMLAGTKKNNLIKETHAGWYNSDGNFFDVTEALGLASKSDFDEPVTYYGIGFSNDLFVYGRLAEEGEDYVNTFDKLVFYSVPVNNLSIAAVKQENPFDWNFNGTVKSENTIRYSVSDWIDSSTCLVDGNIGRKGMTGGFITEKYTSFIYDITSDTRQEYVPGTARSSWNGVMSPERDRIAFLSCTIKGTEAADLYIIKYPNGEPEKIPNNFSFQGKQTGGEPITRPLFGVVTYTLLDWYNPDISEADIAMANNTVIETNPIAPESDFDYEINKDSDIIITRYKGTAKKVILPNEIDGKKIVKIDRAFSGKDKIESITLPEGLTEIGTSAFHGCKSLKEINIPNGVTIIGKEAFNGCSSLSEIIIPNEVTEIGYAAFQGCRAITEINIPDSVIRLGSYAFNQCEKLISVSIGNGLTEIDVFTFNYCINLEKCSLGENVTKIGTQAFADCKSLVSITIPDSVNIIDNNAFYSCGSLEKIIFPEGLTEIGGNAFYNCKKLEAINLPSSLEILGNSIFSSCEALSEVTIEDGVTELGSGMFSKCTNLKKVAIPSSVKKMQNSFSGCTKLEEVTYNGKTYNYATLDELEKAVNGE